MWPIGGDFEGDLVGARVVQENALHIVQQHLVVHGVVRLSEPQIQSLRHGDLGVGEGRGLRRVFDGGSSSLDGWSGGLVWGRGSAVGLHAGSVVGNVLIGNFRALPGVGGAGGAGSV